MTLKEAKECIKNKYPKATAIYSAEGKGVFIHETHYMLSPIIGPHIAVSSSTSAWKETALMVFGVK